MDYDVLLFYTLRRPRLHVILRVIILSVLSIDRAIDGDAIAAPRAGADAHRGV